MDQGATPIGRDKDDDGKTMTVIRERRQAESGPNDEQPVGSCRYRNNSEANSFRYARQLGHVCPPSVSLYVYRILC